jgi:hypothetical protein
MANPYDMTKPFTNRAQAVQNVQIQEPGALDYADRVDTSKLEKKDKKQKMISKEDRVKTKTSKIDSFINSKFNQRMTSITDRLGNLLFNPKKKINYVIKGADLLTGGKVSKNVEEAVSQVRAVGEGAFKELSTYKQKLVRKLKDMGGGIFTREMDKTKLNAAQKEVADEIDEVANLQNEINSIYKAPTTNLANDIKKAKKPELKKLEKEVKLIDKEKISMVDVFPGLKTKMPNPVAGLGKGIPQYTDTAEQVIFNFASRPLINKYGLAKFNDLLRAKDPKVMGPISESLGKHTKEMKELMAFKFDLLKTYYDDLVDVARKFPEEQGKGFLDFSHKFPTSITQRLNPSSELLQKGADPSMMYISPAFVNRRVQVFFDDVAEQLMGTPPKGKGSSRPDFRYPATDRFVSPFEVGANKGQFIQMLKNKQQGTFEGISPATIKIKQKSGEMAKKTIENIREGLKRVQAESMYDLPPEMGGFIQAGKPGGIVNKQQMRELLDFLLDPSTDASTLIAPYKDGGSVFTNPFLKKIDEVFNPITNEPPAGVTDQPPEGGFLEPIAEGITETFTTPEGRRSIFDAMALQQLEDKIEVIQRNREIDEITDDAVQSYLKSIDNAKNIEMQFKADMSNVTAGLDRDGNFMDSFNNPFLQQMMDNGQRPTSLDVQQAYDVLKDSDEYKMLTNTLFSQDPEIVKNRKKVQSKLFANQLKTLPADIADVLVNTYQFISPFAHTGAAFADLEETRMGFSSLEKLAADAGYDRVLDMYLPGGPFYEEGVEIDFAEIQEIVDENRIFARDPNAKEIMGAAATAGLSAIPLFIGSGYFGRMLQTANRRDISKLGKFFRLVPQAAGMPSVKELRGFLGALWMNAKAAGTNKDALKNLSGLISELSAKKVQEKTDAYYEAKRNELENPQFLQQREMFRDQILKAYRGDTAEQVVNPEDFDKMLNEQDENEKIPDYVREIAFEEAMNILKEEQFKLLGKDPPDPKTQPDESLFEEVTGVDLVPGENVRGMAMGGDPGQFTDPLRMPDDDAIDVRGIQEDAPYLSIDELDLFEEANLKPTLENQMPEVQLASANIFGKLPGWAVYLDKKSDLLGTGKQTQNLIRIGDQVAEATKSPTENINRFYSNLEAKLLDPSVPDTFTTPEELFNFFQSRNIGKLEVEDYQLPQLFQSIFQSGQPVTKAQLLSRIKEAPIRKLKSQTFGFRSEIDNGDGQFIDYKYGDGHFEPGANPGTYRESVIYLKPDDIPGDPAAYRHSVHNFFPADDAYVVGWSRLTDRPAIIPGTSKQLSGDTTTKLLELEKKRDRLTAITNKSAQDIVDQSGGRVSIEQAQKNIDNAQKQLTKIQNDIDNFGSGAKQAAVGDKTVNVTFADEIQSDIFQRYRKHLEQTKDEYQKLVSKIGETKARDPRFIRDEMYSSDVNALTLAYYAKHKDILRPVFRTEQDFVGHIKALQESNAIMKEFAQIRPGMLTEGAMIPVREAQKQRDNVLKFFDEIRVDPDTLKTLFPNVPFKDRKAWGDVLVKNDLHMAAKRLFVDGDQNAPTWYAITPAKLVANRYSQAGTTATPIGQRAGKKGVGTYEFYGGPDATDVNGKHYTSILEQSLKRAANINNAEFKIIKVAIGNPEKQNKVIQIVDLSGGEPTVIKTIKVKKGQTREAMTEATDFINSQPNPTTLSTNTTSTPSGFETVDAYAIKLTPEMVLPSKTHMAIGGYVKYDPMPNIEEVIGAA